MYVQLQKIAAKDLLTSLPNSVLINNLKNQHPVIISGIEEVAKLRQKLKEIVIKFKDINAQEYGYHEGLLKTNNAIYTHSNPITDKIDLCSGHEPSVYPETYRQHKWVDLPEYKETIKELFHNFRPFALQIARHIDAYMKTQKIGQNYQSLEKMTSESQLATSRSFYYRERTLEDCE